MFQKYGNLGRRDGKEKVCKNGKKKRGPHRQTVTLGGLKKIQTAKKRKERQRLNRKMAEMQVQGGWKGKKA